MHGQLSHSKCIRDSFEDVVLTEINCNKDVQERDSLVTLIYVRSSRRAVGSIFLRSRGEIAMNHVFVKVAGGQ